MGSSILIILLDLSIIFLSTFVVVDTIFNSNITAKFFKLKDFFSVTMCTVNFLYLPYKTELNWINSNSLYNSDFPWHMEINTLTGKEYSKFQTIWKSYKNLWNYLLSIAITTVFYIFSIVIIFVTLYGLSSTFIEFYRDTIYFETYFLVYMFLALVLPPILFTTVFLAIVAVIKVVYYLLYEIFSGSALISLEIYDYLVHFWNYFTRSERDNLDEAADVSGVHNLNTISFSVLLKSISIWDYVYYTYYNGFTTYLIAFAGCYYAVFLPYLITYLICFTNFIGFLSVAIFYTTALLVDLFNIVLLQSIVYIIIGVVCLLLIVAYYTLFERKVMGSVQRRTGPKFVGYWGILQPISDGLKLLTKEIIIVRNSNIFLFFLAPIISFVVAICLWAAIPFSNSSVISDFHLGLFFIFTISSLNVYGVMVGGWASRSQYSLVGALRATSQVISYELSFGFLFLVIRLISGSFNVQSLVISQYLNGWLIFLLFPFFIIFLILMLAETNRAPYDLAEAEAELVAGFHTEYSAILFALFFLAEYANMFMMSVLGALIFLGGWLPTVGAHSMGTLEEYIILTSNPFLNFFILAVKSLLFAIFFIIVRAALPRYRFDQLLTIGWKRLLPISFGLFTCYLALIYFFCFTG